MLDVRLIESEGLGERSSSGAQLALTDSELDPELEGNGAGKLNDINQRPGISICILELSEVSEINKSAGCRAKNLHFRVLGSSIPTLRLSEAEGAQEAVWVHPPLTLVDWFYSGGSLFICSQRHWSGALGSPSGRAYFTDPHVSACKVSLQ